MNRQLAAITGIEAYVPEYRLTNTELEKLVDTNDEWIVSRTGIKERRILKDPGKAVSDMAAIIVDKLLKKTNTSPDEIELVICCTVTGDMVFPDTANIICDKVGIKNAFAFDINAACSGFLFGLTTGSKFIEAGTHKKVIVIGADKMSSIIDYTDRATCIIFGDGGGAVLLEPSKDGHGIVDSVLCGDGSGREYLHMKAGGSLRPASAETVANKEHYVYQEGKAVFKSAINGMVDTVQKVLKRNHLTTADVDWLVPHQANIRIINGVADGLDFDKSKVMINIEKYGNTTAGTLPLCLHEWEPKLKKGDKIVLTTFGGGFTWGATYLTWAY
ncbi:MAG: beta-ketoacyl-ACP synthase III [Saprospiraceae bacterium]|jgi:3-oxoacyl-[acyl-carrier-protein] synthase-3|nr:ketoacyl-ACP synthase III [Saprospiraceae bacterium]MBK9993356.1 ketoacyl-ACP synthase III [Saprospiraceae bacterium]